MSSPVQVRVDPERAKAICSMLIEGHSTTAIGMSYGKTSSWVWQVAQTNGLTYDRESQRWYEQGQTPVKTIPEATPGSVAAGVVQMLLDGQGRREIAGRLGITDNMVRGIAKRQGLIHIGSPTSGKWIRKEDAAMSTEAGWNMSTEDYEALLTPERDHTNGSGQEEAAAATDEPIDVDDIETTIQEARLLLQQAKQQRETDLGRIEQLNGKAAAFNNEATTYQAQARQLEQRVVQLEKENKDLMDKLKREISRGLLRQDMDNLRKVL